LESPFAPFSIPAWSAALKAVDQSPSHLVEASKSSKHFGHYAFPEPGLFIGSKEKMTRCITSWLRARDVWFLCLEQESSLAMSQQHWRTFLTVDLSLPEKGKGQDTKAAQRRREVLDMITPKFNDASKINIRFTLTEPLVWQGKEYPPGVLPPEDVV
jgi:hypothetical protein